MMNHRQIDGHFAIRHSCLVTAFCLFALLQCFSPFLVWAGSKEDSVAGFSAVKDENFDEAILLLSRAIAAGNLEKECLASALNNRGIAYRRKGSYDLAFADYNQAILLEPDFAIAYSNRGLAYAKIGKYDQAIVDFSEALRLEPDNADIYLKRGNACFDKKDYELAIADYSWAIKLKPDLILAYYNRGDARVMLNLSNVAIIDYRKALELDPNFMRAKERLQWLFRSKVKKG